VFIAPAAIIEFDASGRRAFTVEPDALRLRPIPCEGLGIRHLHGRHQVDDFAHIFAFCGGGWRERCTEQKADKD
jgi:hypothetical protein